MIKHEVKTSKNLYRKIFRTVQDEFFGLAETFKRSYKCTSCGHCRAIRYIEKSPQEIYTLATSDGERQAYWNDFISLFMPVGVASSIDWGSDEFDLDKNHAEAKLIDPDYVDEVLAFTSKAVFYTANPKEKRSTFLPAHSTRLSCKNYPEKLVTVLHEECIYREWQAYVIDYIKKDLSQQVYGQITAANDVRHEYQCHCTGTCCRLSSSEFDYETLKQKAAAGDTFAQQFISIFIPYNSTDDARKIFPDYVEYVINELGKDEQVHFYHCPHITDDNLCSIYTSDKRPQICEDFPNNPLSILYPSCGYIEWKQRVNVTAMSCHAMVEILTFVLDKLECVTKKPLKI